MKLKFLAVIFLIYAMVGCKKEKNDDPDLSKIADVIGSYQGDYNHEFGWVLYSPTITKSDDNTLLINYWPSGAHSIVFKNKWKPIIDRRTDI